MKNKDSKVALGIGAAALAVGGFIWLLTRKPQPSGPITLTIYDHQGKVVPANTPVSLYEEMGAGTPSTHDYSYSIKLRASNKSTRAGAPIAVPLDIGLRALDINQGVVLPQSWVNDAPFGPNESRDFWFPFPTTYGQAGKSGNMYGELYDPNRAIELAEAIQDFVIVPKVVNPDVTAMLYVNDDEYQWLSSGAFADVPWNAIIVIQIFLKCGSLLYGYPIKTRAVIKNPAGATIWDQSYGPNWVEPSTYVGTEPYIGSFAMFTTSVEGQYIWEIYATYHDVQILKWTGAIRSTAEVIYGGGITF